ncbi:MAG TPA: hypothetical protein DHW82_11590 [Spirochaetia bacterium]|nr:MAG: hypothetical protein A2Y41_12115 [Spirochaetes bacterium GWB1_36_13]HCL57635.1 hypothetical protein [Spirochaetia bacterium]
MKKGEKFGYYSGVVLSLFGVFWFVLYLAVETKQENDLPFLIAIVFFPVLLGSFLIYRNKKKAKIRMEKEKLENGKKSQLEIMKLAAKKEGRLTVSDVSIHFSIDPKESEKLLDECVSNKIAEIRVAGSGIVVYLFKELLPNREGDPLEMI